MKDLGLSGSEPKLNEESNHNVLSCSGGHRAEGGVPRGQANEATQGEGGHQELSDKISQKGRNGGEN